MEVAIGGSNSTPFREVHEWQHVDPNTGALINSRLESDRWVNGPLNTYGKMVQHNLSTPDGTNHTHKKQMEILQARTSSGSYQVVRAQTVHSSSSRWSSSSTSGASSNTNEKSSSSSINLNSLLNTATNPHHIYNNFHIPKLQQFQHHHHQQQQQSHQQLQQHKEVDLLQSKNLRSSLLMPTENKFTNNVGGGFSNNSNSNTNNHMDLNKKSNLNERETCDVISAGTATTESTLMRGKSISTEDLKTEDNFDNDLDEPIEWKRVSKIRRSLQFPRTTAPKIQTRPLDLPENSVSVFKIRQELENGRRLSTAMKNNHVDFVALDNILKNVTETTGSKLENKTKKTTFITAESLKEIRGKLRRLSNESLYREDMSPTDESINSGSDEQKFIHSANEPRHTVQINKESPTNDSDICSHTVTNSVFLTNQIGTTNSLDTPRNRVKDKDTPNEDWLLRRKSYAFEKMTHPSVNLSNMDSSTDSGIGRSSDISSSWSNMENVGRGTVVTLGETNKLPITNTTRITLNENGLSDDSKRHSIAVDESRYVRKNAYNIFEKKTSVLVNSDSYSTVHEGSSDENNKKHKRVEFCKTEVHFAPDSGRVNIVETDGKPPSTNNFRRRRRTTSGNVGSSYLDAINSGMGVTHFGDTKNETLVAATSTSESATALVEISQSAQTVVTTSIGKVKITDGNRYENDETDMNLDDGSIRGILKNKPVKPKPYHLGENMDDKESLWGVRLRPVTSDYPSRRHLDIERTLSPPVTPDHPLLEAKPLKDSPTIGYSTKVNLTATIPQSFAWQKKDSPISTASSSLIAPLHLSMKGDQQLQSTTKICIDMTSGDVNRDSNSTDEVTSTPSPSSSTGNEFKSTSLIMKTLRSANQFDEALKKLELISNKQELENRNSAFHLVRSTIAKSNSANSIFRERPSYSLSSTSGANKYASSLDGGDYRNPNDFLEMREPNDLLESINEENNKSYFNRTSTTSTSFKTNYERNTNELSRLSNFKDFVAKHYSGKSDNILKEHNFKMPPQQQTSTTKPIAAPRIKKLESNVLSHQLSQLRRMYDAAEQDDSDDSAKADEEVNSYLGALATTPDDKAELSGSWSRVKAKRNSLKQSIGVISNTATCVANSEFRMVSSKSNPDSVANIISFCLNDNESTTVDTPKVLTVQPRVIFPAKVQHPQPSPVFQRKDLIVSTTPSMTTHSQMKSDDKKNFSKLSPGTRQLRQHELSYFGIPANNGTNNISFHKADQAPKSSLIRDTKSSDNLLSSSTKSILTSTINTNKQNIKNTLNGTSSAVNISSHNHHNYQHQRPQQQKQHQNKWQLTNDKPDLLKHNPVVDPTSSPALASNFTKSYSLSKNSKLRSSSAASSIKSVGHKDERRHIGDLKKPHNITNGDEPCYENLPKDSKYDRKLDLNRDEQILEELTRAADEMLNSVKDLSDGDSDNEFRKGFIKQKSPSLDTINEIKATSQKIMKSKGVQVSKHFENGRTLRSNTNSKLSSASSSESVTQTNIINSRNSSINRWKPSSQYTNGYHNRNHNVTPVASPASSRSSSRRKITNSAETTRRIHRVCSKEKLQQQSHGSSSEDLSVRDAGDAPRPRPRRTKNIKEREKNDSIRTSKSNDSKNSSLTQNNCKNIFERLSSTKSSSRGITNSIAEQQKMRTKTGTILTATTPSNSRRTMR